MNKFEKDLRKLKIFLFSPLLRLFTILKINAYHVSFLGLIFAVLMFVSLLYGDIKYAVIFFIINFFLDMFDGSLARYQKKASDKGKFFDMVMDSVTATLLILGLAIITKINPINGAVFIYLMLLSLIFACIINDGNVKSDWLFHSRAGTLSQFPKNIFYLFFVLWGLNVIDLMNISIFIFNIYLGILVIIDFIKVLRIKC